MIENTARSLLDLNVTGSVPFSAIVLVPTTNAPATCLTTPTLHLQGLLISFLFAKKPKIINFGTFSMRLILIEIYYPTIKNPMSGNNKYPDYQRDKITNPISETKITGSKKVETLALKS